LKTGWSIRKQIGVILDVLKEMELREDAKGGTREEALVLAMLAKELDKD